MPDRLFRNLKETEERITLIIKQIEHKRLFKNLEKSDKSLIITHIK
jgi:hypothetical protein